ncbi:MAG: tyrosine-type recombinase/integrase, partial [Nitrososphaera sp.]
MTSGIGSRKGREPKNNRKYSVSIRSALDEAAEDELIETNPLAGKKVRRKSSGRDDEIDPFTSEERGAIQDAASGQEHNLILFALWTGMRIFELCALNGDDVDWHKGTVRVDKALTQPAKQSEAPKTQAGIRQVKLLFPAVNALQDQKTYTYLKEQEIFQNPRTGERWTGDMVIRQRMWKRILKKAK